MTDTAPTPVVAAVSILAVIVLYNQAPEASPALSSLVAALEKTTTGRERFHLLIYDNSSQASATPPSQLGLSYRHDPDNPGLAAAYNYALEQARQKECIWLLLLDQDTIVSNEYLQEALQLTSALANDRQVSAIVPKLRSDLGIKSPTLDFLEWLRRQVQFPRKRKLYADISLYGVQQEQWSAFNSASFLRVSAMINIGGFPTEFWLDFLDVAVFNALHQAGGRLFVMHAVLQHELSMDTKIFYEKESGLRRHKNLISAMIAFVRKHGTPRDLWLTRMWLLRNSVTLFVSAKDKRFSAASLRQATRLSLANIDPRR